MVKICYWSIADGEYSYMLQALVHSYRKVGMQEDFHAFSDQTIAGAITHPIENFSKELYLFKFDFLQKFIKNLDYDYFIFLDADNYFIRQPPSLLELIEEAPFHCFLESDCTLPCKREEWHSCRLSDYVRFMHECGVADSHIYTMNAGFFIIKREAIDLVCSLASEFWTHCMLQKHLFTEEAPLVYVMQMLTSHPEQHLLSQLPNIWCTDWTGVYKNRLPDGKGWTFYDYMNDASFPVNPAIVHALKSKKDLIEYGRKVTARGFL